ncbi:hypothetical protein Dimus_003125, partial [Dionaea muscipula]
AEVDDGGGGDGGGRWLRLKESTATAMARGRSDNAAIDPLAEGRWRRTERERSRVGRVLTDQSRALSTAARPSPRSRGAVVRSSPSVMVTDARVKNRRTIVCI